MTCPTCSKELTHSVEKYRYEESGLGNVFVRGVGIYRCTCGVEVVQLPPVKEIHKAIAMRLIEKVSLLTGAEFKFLRKAFRFTSEQMGSLLGVSRAEVSRWENGKVPLTPAVDHLVRLLTKDKQQISIALDFQRLFEDMSLKPDKNFTIVLSSKDMPIGTSVESNEVKTITASRVEVVWPDFILPPGKVMTAAIAARSKPTKKTPQEKNELAAAA